MSDYVILTDSSCDLPAAVADALDIRSLPLVVNIHGREYYNYLDGRELSPTDFYAQMRAGAQPFTSAANVDMFLQEMDAALGQGKDVLCISFDSSLSGTFLNANAAANQMREKYPDRTVYCIDSKCASMGQGLLVYLAVRQKRAGMDIHQLHTYVTGLIPKICHWFIVGDLRNLKRGGRISAGATESGALLHIKTVFHVDDEGKLVSVEKVRGRDAAIRALLSKMAATAEHVEAQTVMISHGDCLEDAQALATLVKRELNPAEIIINMVGPVIGTHAGPGTLAIFFLGSHR